MIEFVIGVNGLMNAFMTTLPKEGHTEHAEKLKKEMAIRVKYGVSLSDKFEIKPEYVMTPEDGPEEVYENWEFNMKVVSKYISQHMVILPKFIKFMDGWLYEQHEDEEE